MWDISLPQELCTLYSLAWGFLLGGFFMSAPPPQKKSSQSCCYTQQHMGHKIIFYKQFIVSIKMQHYSKAAFLHLPLTPGNTSSKREHERRIFHPCIFFLPFTAGLIKRVVSDGGRVCRGESQGALMEASDGAVVGWGQDHTYVYPLKVLFKVLCLGTPSSLTVLLFLRLF